MLTRIKKHKFGTLKPASQLFLFSNKLNKNIDSYFSGNIIFENDLSNYDFTNHVEARQILPFMYGYCKSRSLEVFQYMTVVLNYNPMGVTMATLGGDYEYVIAINGSLGYKQLASIHSVHLALDIRLASFYKYKCNSLSYASIAQNDPINLPDRNIVALKNQLKKTEQSILKSISKVVSTFNKKFQPSYQK